MFTNLLINSNTHIKVLLPQRYRDPKLNLNEFNFKILFRTL